MTIIWCMVPEIWSATDRIFCHSGPFFALWTQKIKICKKWKKHQRYYHFTTVYHKWQSYDVWFLTYGVQHTTFFVIFDHSCPFTPITTRKLKFWKNEENTWRYYHFTHVYHKWHSYDVWFLRYGVWQTEIFVILDNFLHFYPPKNLENQNFEKMKKTPGDIIIYTCVP